MKPRQLQSLRRVAEVRDAQEAAAAMAARQAVAALDAAQARRSEETGRQDEREAAWTAAFTAPVLQLEAAQAWAAALDAGAGRLDALSAEVDQAEAGRTASREAWRTAHGRAQVAQVLARDGARRLRRRAEEAALGDLADRLAARRLRHED